MAHLWHPDTCGPDASPCVLEIVDGHKGLVRVIRLCAHHAAIRAGLANDDVLFDAVLATNRAKNRAVDETQKELGTVEINGTKAIPPWRIEADDRVIITTGLNATRRTRLQNAIDTRLGAGKVIVE